MKFEFFRRQESSSEGAPPAKQACGESRAIMTTQAVTPASAAAGLGLLMHPNMLMMHQMNAMQQIHATQMQAANPSMQQMGLMMQQMQQAAAHQQAAGAHQPAVSLPPMTSPLTSSALTSSPLTSSSMTSSPFGKSLFNPAGLGLQQHSSAQAAAQAAAAVRQGSPSQIVPTNPLINSRATLDSIGAQVNNLLLVGKGSSKEREIGKF